MWLFHSLKFLLLLPALTMQDNNDLFVNILLPRPGPHPNTTPTFPSRRDCPQTCSQEELLAALEKSRRASAVGTAAALGEPHGPASSPSPADRGGTGKVLGRYRELRDVHGPGLGRG